METITIEMIEAREKEWEKAYWTFGFSAGLFGLAMGLILMWFWLH